MGNSNSTRLGDSFQAHQSASGIAGREASATSPRAWLHQVSARNALVHAADQGNLALLKLICDSAEGRTFHGVNDGASKCQAPLMRACTHGSQRHAECVAYLLLHGADVYAQSSRKDNAMHIAAKHGNAGALNALLSFRPHADGEDGSQLLGDIVVQGDAGPTRFIDLHNGSGVTALHLAALKGSVAAVRELLRAGAAADAVTLSGVHSPQLSRGSTALHIAAARGHAGCVTALLEHQAGVPGMELQRLRNARGLKPSQLARLAGHHSVARLLSEVNIQTTPQPLTSSAAGVSTSAAPAEPLRRVARAALPTRQEPGRLSLEQGGISQEALLVALVQRAKLLLSLRAASLSLEGSPPESSAIGNEEAALVALSADVAAALRGKGSGNTSADSTNTLLGLLASLAETNSADDSQHAKPANAKTSNAEEAQARTQQKSAKSIAAGALVQAALNAMAVSTPGSEPATAAAGFLAPASPVAAIIAVQAALKKLSSQRVGARLFSVPTRHVAGARSRVGAGTVPSLQHASHGASSHSANSAAPALNGASTRTRRRRRSNALRLSLSGISLASRGAEAAEGAASSSHAAQRRRRHRRSGSFGSSGYPAAQPTPCQAAGTGDLSLAGADAHAHIALRRSGHSASPERTPKLSSVVDPMSVPGVSAGAPVEAVGLQTLVSAEPESAGGTSDATGGAPARDSAATELPETWVSALHSTDSMDALSEAIESLEGPAGPPESSRPPAGMDDSDACLYTGSSAQAASSPSAKQHKSLTHQHRQEETLDLLGNELEPLLPSNAQCNGTAGSSRQAEDQPRLRVRSRLFSTSEDGLLGASRQVLATSPTNPFDTAEVLGSDSIPSSPFGDSMAGDWLHVRDALLDSGGDAQRAWPADDLLVRGSFLPDAELSQTEDSDMFEGREAQWKSSLSHEAASLHNLTDTIPIEAIVRNDTPHVPQASGSVPQEADEGCGAGTVPSLPLPGSAAAQVAEAFGKRATFHRSPSKSLPPATSVLLPPALRHQTGAAAASATPAHSFGLSKVRGSPAVPGLGSAMQMQPPLAEPAEGSVSLERQASAAPAPGTAAAEVRRAFSKIMSSSRSSTAETPSRSAYGCVGATGASEQAAEASAADSAAGPSPAAASLQPAEQQQHTQAHMVGTEVSHAGGEILETQHSMCKAVSSSHRSPDQQAPRSRPLDQKTDASSTAAETAAQGQRMGRAMSLKGAAAADTALAFSCLQSRAGSSPVEQHLQPTPLPACNSGQPAAAAAPAVTSPAHSALQQRRQQAEVPLRPNTGITTPSEEWPLADPRSAHAASQPCARPASSSQELTPVTGEWEDSQAQASHAAGMGRPVRALNSGQLSAGSQPTSSRHSEGRSEPQVQHGDGMLRPGPSMEGRAIDIWDAGRNPQHSGSLGEHEHAEEAENTVELAQARADRKLPSPRKRASLGRRLSGMLPGVKGKERAKAPFANKEACSICMDAALEVSMSSCCHSLCRQCAYQLCARGLAAPLCPFCRGPIQRFEAMPRLQPPL